MENKNKKNNNSCNSLVFGRWPQTKIDIDASDHLAGKPKVSNYKFVHRFSYPGPVSRNTYSEVEREEKMQKLTDLDSSNAIASEVDAEVDVGSSSSEPAAATI